jgi:hypothetical protein
MRMRAIRLCIPGLSARVQDGCMKCSQRASDCRHQGEASMARVYQKATKAKMATSSPITEVLSSSSDDSEGPHLH